MRLHLGVMDVPYKEGSNSNTKTTGDVAEILETKYNVMAVFYEEHAAQISDWLAESVADQVEAMMGGAPAPSDPFQDGTQNIEARFKDFLALREMDSLGIPGVPTRAAQMGVSHRFKHPYAKRAPRPSFIDTSLYVSSMKVWVEK